MVILVKISGMHHGDCYAFLRNNQLYHGGVLEISMKLQGKMRKLVWALDVLILWKLFWIFCEIVVWLMLDIVVIHLRGQMEELMVMWRQDWMEVWQLKNRCSSFLLHIHKIMCPFYFLSAYFAKSNEICGSPSVWTLLAETFYLWGYFVRSWIDNAKIFIYFSDFLCSINCQFDEY